MNGEAVERLTEALVPLGAKGWPPSTWGRPLREAIDLRLRLTDGDVPMPCAVLHQSALLHNLEAMAHWAEDHGALLAPHAKTTMAPQLMLAQHQAGAWGFTAATPAHAQLYAAFGAKRVLYANQVVEAGFARWLAEAHDVEVIVLVDSPSGAQLLDRLLAEAGCERSVAVLVEVGVAGGRSGVRTLEQGLEAAGAVEASPHLRLIGVEAFEGLGLALSAPEALAAVDELLHRVDELAERLQRAAGSQPFVVSVGGSAFFDRVIARLAGPGRQVVLRSGAYLIHDDGAYRRLSALGDRSSDGGPRLQSALEVWSAVLSRPEPGLAITSMGKRDVGADVDMPRPTRRLVAGRLEPIEGARIIALSDQHAHVALPDEAALEPGDLMACSVSHPCTTMDRWRLLPVVDDELRVVDGITTFF